MLLKMILKKVSPCFREKQSRGCLKECLWSGGGQLERVVSRSNEVNLWTLTWSRDSVFLKAPLFSAVPPNPTPGARASAWGRAALHHRLLGRNLS